jgi:hypothetical protein
LSIVQVLAQILDARVELSSGQNDRGLRVRVTLQRLPANRQALAH